MLNPDRKMICEKYGSKYHEFLENLNVGVNIESLGMIPVYGVRINPAFGTSGWYIWGGKYSEDEDFFKPIHGFHLIQKLPGLSKYLALAPGFKFIVDGDGYEDVWFDPSSLKRAGQSGVW
ncbi:MULTISPECIES: hypothetical protein [Comamonadaceae]|uniref:immunity protein Imm33 domain-containing protein n=1 Tax=Acidovorax sacchari TaxID=3230736 RepID=UPI0034A38EC2